MLDPASPVPLYHQLAEELLGQIRRGVFAPGDKLPSEHELAARHGIGRPTVRQATDSLIQRGLLVRRRGSGTFVRNAPATVDLFSLAGTLVSFEQRGIVIESTLRGRPRVERIERDPEHPLSGKDAVRVVRISQVEHEPVLLEEIDFDAARFAGLSKLALEGRSLSEVVEAHYQMRPKAADQSFRVERLDAARAALLRLSPKSHVLRVDRTLHFPLAESAVHARMYCRQGRFVFSQRIGGYNHA